MTNFESILDEWLVHDESCSLSRLESTCDCIMSKVKENLLRELTAAHTAEVKAARIDELDKYYVEISDLMSEGTPGVDDLVERGYLENYFESRKAALQSGKETL